MLFATVSKHHESVADLTKHFCVNLICITSVVQGLCGTAVCESEKVQPRLSNPDQRMFWSPSSNLGQIR